LTRNSLFKGGQIAITLPDSILLTQSELEFNPIETVNPFGNVTFAFEQETRSLVIRDAFDQ